MTASEQKLMQALQIAAEAIEEMKQEPKVDVQVRIPSTYETKTDIAKTFGVSRACVYKWLPEFEEVVLSGRYGPYAILDDRINVAAFADFIKYRRWFKDRDLKRNIPIFRLHEAINVIIPETVAQ